MTPLIALAAAAALNAAPAGVYLERGQLTTVRFAPCGPAVCGRLVFNIYLKADPDLRDVHNPDPALRRRPVQDLAVFEDLRWERAAWRGRAYLPSQGRTYPVTFTPRSAGRLDMQLCTAPGDCHPAVWERRPE